MMRSLLAPVIACQNWISVTACAEAAAPNEASSRQSLRKDEMRCDMEVPPGGKWAVCLYRKRNSTTLGSRLLGNDETGATLYSIRAETPLNRRPPEAGTQRLSGAVA